MNFDLIPNKAYQKATRAQSLYNDVSQESIITKHFWYITENDLYENKSRSISESLKIVPSNLPSNPKPVEALLKSQHIQNQRIFAFVVKVKPSTVSETEYMHWTGCHKSNCKTHLFCRKIGTIHRNPKSPYFEAFSNAGSAWLQWEDRSSSREILDVMSSWSSWCQHCKLKDCLKIYLILNYINATHYLFPDISLV